MQLPAGWTEQRISAANAEAASQLKEWWTEFHDPVLTQLVGDVIDGNLQLQIARQKLLEARADRTIAASQALPQVAGRRVGHRRSQQRDAEVAARHRLLSQLFLRPRRILGTGCVRRHPPPVAGGGADIQATIENRRAILVALLAEMATDYAELRATQLRLDIARHNLGIARRALDLTAPNLSGA